jgi:hypothetical protein
VTTGHDGTGGAGGRGPTGFPDEMRTSRNHAGEALADGYNIPGLVLAMIGTIGLAAALTAVGYGFHGWAVVAAIVAAAGLFGGVGWVLVEHRRIKAKEGLRLRDQVGH